MARKPLLSTRIHLQSQDLPSKTYLKGVASNERGSKLWEQAQSTTDASKRKWLPMSRDAWLFEVIGLLLTLVGLGCLTVVLKFYENQPPPTNTRITLGAIVAVLAAIISGMTGMILASCMAQLKWNRYAPDIYPLFDFYAIDDASKGPLGSLKFLFRRPSSIAVAICALAVLSNKAVETFLQQIISLSPREVPLQLSSAQASLPVTHNFLASPEIGGRASVYTVGMTLKSAVYNGLFAPSSLSSTVTATFPRAANATWHGIWSIAVCSECADVSADCSSSMDTVKSAYNHGTARVANYWNLTLPNGHMLNTLPDQNSFEMPVRGGFWNQLNVSSLNPSIRFPNHTAVLADFSTLFMPANASDASHIRASECVLQLCAQQYDATVIDGIFTEHTTVGSSSFPLDEHQPEQLWMSANSSDYRLHRTNQTHNTNLAENGNNISLTFSSAAGSALAMYLRLEILTGMTTITFDSDDDSGGFSWTTQNHNNSDILQAFNSTIIPSAQTGLDFPTQVANIAKSLTQAIRQYNGSQVNVAPTTSWHDQVLVDVRWPWISLPAVVLLITFLMFIFTIINTYRSRSEPWKGNILAVLAVGLDQHTRKLLREKGELSGMKKEAKRLQVSRVDAGDKIPVLEIGQGPRKRSNSH